MSERTLPPGHVNLNVGGPPLHPATIKMFEDAKNRPYSPTPSATPIAASEKLSALVAGCVAQGLSACEAKSHVYGIYRELVAEWAAELAATNSDSNAILTAAPTTPAAIAHRCEAIREWKSDPSVRLGFTSMTNYVVARASQLSGALKTIGEIRPGASRLR